jgi:hypothetical protein
MTELGPFHLSAESLAGNPTVPKLVANPYSWDHVGQSCSQYILQFLL